MSKLAARLQKTLRAMGTPARAIAEKKYLKSELEHFGVPVPKIRGAVVAELRGLPELTRGELLEAVEELWSTEVHELRTAAVELLAKRVRLLGPGDMKLLERLLREAKTWALVDAIAPHVVGSLFVAHPGIGKTLDRWAKDEDFWIRRAALLSLLVPLREGGGDLERFGRYADAMLGETEFFIRKAIGWILRDMSRKRPDEVYAWLLPRAKTASGVTVREAVKKLSPQQRAAIERARAIRRVVD